jgi:superfamily II DNA or RNA helicase
MQLRPYQESARQAAHEQWKTHRSTIVVMATGLGKSSTLAFIIKDFQPQRTIVICHRRELIWQLKEEIETVTGLSVAIEMGDVFSDETLFEKAQVIVATVQTLSRRLAKFRPHEFGLLVYDEAHHSVAPVNRKVVEHFMANPALKMLLTTATPERADEKALGQVCESTAFDYGIFDGVADGWLVDITAQFCNVKHLDLSKVHTTAGDLNQGELAKIMERDEIVMGVAQPIVEVSYGLKEHTLDNTPPDKWAEYLATLPQAPRRGIVFTVTVEQAEGLSKLLRMAHPKLAESVHAKTPPEDRTEIFGRFKTGETSLIVNVGICTEGYNNPGVQTIFIARPTKSRSLYMQMIGRSTRPLPGLVDGLETAEERKAAIAASPKPWARLVDFAGNTGRHDIISPWDILGGNVSDDVVARAIRKAKKDGKPVRVIANLNNTELEVKAKAVEDEKARVLARSQFHMGNVDLMRGGNKQTLWQSSKMAASATPKQINVMRRAGVHPDFWVRRMAGWIIGKLVENQWRLPAEIEFVKRPKNQKA